MWHKRGQLTIHSSVNLCNTLFPGITGPYTVADAHELTSAKLLGYEILCTSNFCVCMYVNLEQRSKKMRILICACLLASCFLFAIGQLMRYFASIQYGSVNGSVQAQICSALIGDTTCSLFPWLWHNCLHYCYPQDGGGRRRRVASCSLDDFLSEKSAGFFIYLARH